MGKSMRVGIGGYGGRSVYNQDLPKCEYCGSSMSDRGCERCRAPQVQAEPSKIFRVLKKQPQPIEAEEKGD